VVFTVGEEGKTTGGEEGVFVSKLELPPKREQEIIVITSKLF